MKIDELVTLGLKYEDKNLEPKKSIVQVKDMLNYTPPDILEKCKSKEINSLELFALYMFAGFHYQNIQYKLFNKKSLNPFEVKIVELYDSFLEKCTSTKANALYRNDSYSHKEDFLEKYKVGDEYECNTFFNTTIEDLEFDCCVILWIITPKKETSNGKEIFEILNQADEDQVTFLRNTRFLIKKIENGSNPPDIKVYCDEL